MPSPYPVVSVVMATYNFERFVARAIESVLAQDYPPEALELIVVDDGSTDSTPEVVQPYLEAAPIKYIRKPNGGLLSTMNRGIAEATGELICLFSGDDEFKPQKTRVQVDFMREHPEVGLVYSDLQVVDDEGGQMNASLWDMANITPVRGRPVGALLKRNVISGGTMMFRSSLKSHYHPIPDFAAWEDWYIALRIASVAEIDYVAEPLYRYRYHGGNMNLGAKGDKLVAVLRTEIPFRRALLADLEPGSVSVTDLLQAWAEVSGAVGRVLELTGEPLEALFDVSDDQRARSREMATAVDDPFKLVAALALDPWNTDAQGALGRLLQPQARVEGARSFATLAFADELVETPEMLTAYGQCFAGGDDATLVVLGDPPEISNLGVALEAAGLDGEDGPDMLALDRSAATTVTAQVQAVYSRRPQQGVPAHVPLVGDASALRGPGERAA
jgi:Glycosyl transferase family 2